MEILKIHEFNPKKPHEFQAYGLLKKILKDRNNALFIDYDFWCELFGSQIFTKEVDNEILDKPQNYRTLEWHEKVRLYLKQYTREEFQRTIDRIQFQLEPTDWLLQHFARYYDGENIHHIRRIAPPIKEILVHTIPNQSINMVFIGNYFRFSDYSTFEVNRIEPTSIFITTKEFVPLLSAYPVLNLFERAHIISLNKLSDARILFDYIERGIDDKQQIRDNNTDFSFLNKFSIQNYFSIDSIFIDNLGDRKEVYFLGENGDGKTILLQAMVLSLCGSKDEGFVIDTIKESKSGDVLLSAQDKGEKNYSFEYSSSGFNISENRFSQIVAYGAGRFRNDSVDVEQTGYATLFSYEKYLENPVNWLKSLDYKEAKQEVPPISLTLAKQILEDLLDNNVKIEVKTDDVWFVERETYLKFHQLSDGNKSVLVWVCDMLARLIKTQPKISTQSDLQGIVFVDEIGLYLHPKWQYNIVSKLRAWFPKIQFIFSTHSPMIILGASKDAVFYRVYKEEGITKISEPVLASTISNQMANGIITAPFLFGLDSARSKSFDPVTQEIDTSDNYVVGHIYKEIRKQLEKRKNVQESEIIKMINSTLENYSSNYQNGKG
ncbi:MAG: AAA family ATPase [Candidatus Kapabacteria bacterium]|nr:AAA family ATPase [Candidatus Kapabacteria bacterium]